MAWFYIQPNRGDPIFNPINTSPLTKEITHAENKCCLNILYAHAYERMSMTKHKN